MWVQSGSIRIHISVHTRRDEHSTRIHPHRQIGISDPEVNVLVSMTCDVARIMAGINVNTRQLLLMKYRRKHQRYRARSRRKLDGIRRAMQQILISQYQMLMMSLTLSAALISSMYSVSKDRTQWVTTSGNPDRKGYFCSH